jgi:hypothetical protein
LGAHVLRKRPRGAGHHHHGLPDRRAPRRHAAGQRQPRRQLPFLRRLPGRAARPGRGRRLSRREEHQLARGPRPATAHGCSSPTARAIARECRTPCA